VSLLHLQPGGNLIVLCSLWALIALLLDKAVDLINRVKSPALSVGAAQPRDSLYTVLELIKLMWGRGISACTAWGK
jgi:hypothetical protein